MISKYQYSFLYFSFEGMDVHHNIFDGETMWLPCFYGEALTGDKRLVKGTLPNVKEYVESRSVYNPYIISNLSYSFNHEFYHIFFDFFYPKEEAHEIEILDYDGRGRI